MIAVLINNKTED